MKNLKNMLGSAVERKPKVEQVNVTGGRLLRESKVCFNCYCWKYFLDPQMKMIYWKDFCGIIGAGLVATEYADIIKVLIRFEFKLA